MNSDGVVCVIVGLVMFLGGCVSGVQMASSKYEKEAIENGYAVHNPQTGKWEWKDSGKEEAKK